MNELIALALRRAGVNTLAEFQALQGLPQTGEADPETQLALEPYLLGFRTIRIQPGDTYWELAARYGTTSQAIATANPSLDPGGCLWAPPCGCPWASRGSNRCAHDLEPVQPVYPRPGGPVSRGLCRMEALTTTAFGRPVEALTMGSGKRRVLYTAAHHANEWITATLLLAFAEDLAKAAMAGAVIGGYPGRELLEVATIHMVPMVDPDGVDLVTGALPADSGDYAFARSLASYYPSIPFPNGWKANLLGIDLNLNYPAGWETAREIKFEQGFTRPGPRDYVGRAPGSAGNPGSGPVHSDPEPGPWSWPITARARSFTGNSRTSMCPAPGSWEKSLQLSVAIPWRKLRTTPLLPGSKIGSSSNTAGRAIPLRWAGASAPCP